MSGAPEISIGLPVASEPVAYVRRAIESVCAQTASDWELIVMCDDSPPETLSFLQGLGDDRIRLHVGDTRRGLAARLNQIAAIARGRYLARMDADDVMFPARIERQTAALDTMGSYDVLGARAVIISLDDSPLGITRTSGNVKSKSAILRNAPIVHPTAFARTAWWRDNPYDIRYERSQDRALWLNSFDHSRFFVMDEPMLFYRVSASLDPSRYARTARCERAIISRFGPATVGYVQTLSLLALSRAKQAVVRAAPALHLERQVLARRFQELTVDDESEYRELLRSIPSC